MTNRLIPAATLILLRDSSHGIDVLLLQRHKNAGFLPGYWVFPGGIIETQDKQQNIWLSAANAACRETKEECGLISTSAQLVPLSRWIAPDIAPKRFDTYFFVTDSYSGNVQPDDHEVSDFTWINARQAINRHHQDCLPILPPTLVHLHEIATLSSTRQAIEHFRQRQAIDFAPRAAFWQDRLVMLYEGDAGFETQDAGNTSSLNRCIQTGRIWEYRNNTGNRP